MEFCATAYCMHYTRILWDMRSEHHFHIIIIVIILSIVSSSGEARFGSHTLTRLLFRMGSPISSLLPLSCSSASQIDLSRRKRILYNVPTALHTRIHRINGILNTCDVFRCWTTHTHASQTPWVYFFHYQFDNCNLNKSMRACDGYHADEFNQQPILIFNPASKFNAHSSVA